MDKIDVIKSKIILMNIKSLYIVKRITSFIKESKKLIMIKCCKKLQKHWKINIDDYKRVSGKYIKFEDDGTITEYIINSNIVIFKGEYLKGKKNGKGVEYFQNNKIKFEGEYLNGKKNGIGKEYNKKGLVYEGEYLDGKKHGKGKEYDKYKNLIYEGEYFNGKRHGQGKEYNNNGIYEVEYLNGEKINEKYINKIKIQKEYKIEYHKNGEIKFEGEYLKGKRNGRGREYNKNVSLIYEGEFVNGIRNGGGKEYDVYGNLIFIGKYLNGERLPRLSLVQRYINDEVFGRYEFYNDDN
jgi:antitoxin component YwqK of YwqJK toxin-antitoxin module